MPRDLACLNESASVKPTARQYRRSPVNRVPIRILCFWKIRIGAVLFGIPLFDHAESAEFALDAVKVTVVIGIRRHKPASADEVVGFGALDDMNNVRQPGDPRPAR